MARRTPLKGFAILAAVLGLGVYFSQQIKDQVAKVTGKGGAA